MHELEEVLGPQGLLARCIEGFCFRPQQLEMAEAVAEALANGDVLISEAGTGTGKTFAYLLPALLSDLKIIVSTGTRNLQDQLYHRDLPLMRELLASSRKVALLKGRANYLCRHRLHMSAEGHHPAEVIHQLSQVRRWASATRQGDIAGFSVLPEDAPVWPLVTSTNENCLGQECPEWNECHLVEARRRAQEADLVVINHHLLCADLALKDEGFGEILPGADAFIVDEAHQLPETASNFFGTTVSGRQLMDLARDTITEYHREAGDMAELPQRADALQNAVREMRLSFGFEPRRGAWSEVRSAPGPADALDKLRTALGELQEVLDAMQGRGKGLDSCLARCNALEQRLDLLLGEEGSEEIRWYEVHRQSFRFNRTPLDISEVFQTHMTRHPAAWVFTSATLAVGDSFTHFERQLGLEGATSHRWDSPFDYPRQALWYVPKGIPDPRTQGFDQAVADISVEVLKASGGRAFLLYTSHRALRWAAGYLEPRIDFPMLVQGEAPRADLLERFRELGNAVLLGTASFWEGVDVRGEALSCVIIDKLPFASPGDPVLQARLDALRARGGNPFMEHQIPQAAIALKQGAGRLIRDAADRGVLVLCDIRILTKPYGRIFIDSMPSMARTRELSDVQRFFAYAAQRISKP
ncbi:MAG TPA: ATP-dependent DNA helicase [Chromatiales bacterium]|nr:ATP-dependent DNA helicase [Chromatiales bacterium]